MQQDDSLQQCELTFVTNTGMYNKHNTSIYYGDIEAVLGALEELYDHETSQEWHDATQVLRDRNVHYAEIYMPGSITNNS